MIVTLEIELPDETVQHYENAGIDWKAQAQKLVQTNLRPAAALQKNGIISAENAAAIALLEQWKQEDATDDPQKIAEAEAEVEEFKRRLNANRAENGERLLFL